MAGFVTIISAQLDPVQETGVRCSPGIPQNNSLSTDCIDVSQPGVVEFTYELASNDTRIETDGLRICAPENEIVQVAEPINVVFAVDQSGSMASNDPNFDAPVAVTNALNSIATNLPNSLVGYMGFANGLCNGTDNGSTQWREGGAGPTNTIQFPGNISDPVVLQALLGQTSYNNDYHFLDCGAGGATGTLYYDPFQTSINMLASAQTISPNNKQIIIFVTDGNPTDRDDAERDNLAQFLALRDSVVQGFYPNFPIVYAIFIGGSNNDLEELADASGGGLIQANDASEIDNILAGIINDVIVTAPLATTVRYENTYGSATLNATYDNQQSDDGEFGLILPQPIPLSLGQNIITVTSNKDGVAHSARVTLNLTGAPHNNDGTFNVTGSPFQEVCEDATEITFTIPGSNQEISLLDPDQNSYVVNVENGPEGNTVKLFTSVPGGDQDSVSVPGGNGSFTKTEQVITTPGANYNGVVEIGSGAEITYAYQHPYDPRDLATATITKSRGPEILSIDKTPSGFKNYIDAETNEIKSFPDTLRIVLTEPLGTGDPDNLSLWENLVLFSDSKTCSADPFSEDEYNTLSVVRVTQIDEVTFEVLTDGSRDAANTLMVGDCAVLNPDAGLNNLTVNPPPVKVIGDDSEVNLIVSGISIPVIGADLESNKLQQNSVLVSTIPVINNQGEVVGEETIEDLDFWIPPRGLNGEGEIDGSISTTCSALGTNTTQLSPTKNCMSRVTVFSQTGYTAKVSISDNLGKVVHSSAQRLCEEDLQVAGREQPEGYVSWLAWNQKDNDGVYVGSGVYVWKVVYKFDSGEEQVSFYKQGIVRGDLPANGCFN